MSGPLGGLKIIEMEAVGPVQWAGMMLADMGAQVLRVDRPIVADMGLNRDERFELSGRGKQTVRIDAKAANGATEILRLIGDADVLLEGLRPGVMERLGLGPSECFDRNPALIYGRMTGWGQTGPRSSIAGHDINYIATTGFLHAIGSKQAPSSPPLDLVGDFGGGGMLLLVGVLAALVERQSSGRGQVVDAAMVDGVLTLMAPHLGRWQSGEWDGERGSHIFAGSAPFYATYETADGKHVAVGAIEPQFYVALLKGLGLEKEVLPKQHDRSSWPQMRSRFMEIFRQRTRDDWCEIFCGTQACVSPVLAVNELSDDAHLTARDSLIEIDGILHPAPAPRFSRTPGKIAGSPARRSPG